jgi:hypothetical protein
MPRSHRYVSLGNAGARHGDPVDNACGGHFDCSTISGKGARAISASREDVALFARPSTGRR